MKKLTVPFILTFVLVVVCGVASVRADTATFTLSFSGINPIYSPGGFTFIGNWSAGLPSPKAPYMNDNGSVHAVTYDAGTFTFNSASFGGLPYDNAGSATGGVLTIDFKDLNGNLIVERTINLPGDNSFQTFTENISGVHELYFPATKTTFWPRLDSITYNEVPGVPEPTTLLFLGLSLIGVAGVRRRLKK